MTQDKSIVARARDFYSVYMASCEGLSWDGKQCPRWEALNDKVRGHWYTVALRSVQLQMHDSDTSLLGEESRILPGTMVFDHLGDEARVESAVGIWTDYVNDDSVQISPNELAAMRGQSIDVDDDTFTAPRIK